MAIAKRSVKPAMDPESREKQLISKAYDLAERQLVEGTASPSVITHFLSLATKKKTLENEVLEKTKVLIEAKASNITKGQENEQLTKKAIQAMKSYRPTSEEDEE